MTRATMAKSCVMAVAIASASLISSKARAQVDAWPSDADWLPLARDGVPIGDPQGDSNPGSIDIVGDADSPAFYVYRDAENFYFRIRVDETPLQNNSFRKFGWGCEIDVDGDLGGYEFIALLDGISSSGEAVTWLRNSEPNTDGSPNDRAERLLATQDVAVYARSVSAGTEFPSTDPDEDFFVDFAIAIADIESTPEVASQEPEDVLDLDQPLTFICGTSANTATLSKDYGGPGTTLEELGSDPVTCDESGCTACNTAAACGASCEVCPGGEVCDADTLTCQAACSGNDDCTEASQPICNTDSGSCVECLTDQDCQSDERCNDDALMCQGDDADADGIADSDEEAAGTDPNDADSDDDGVPDGTEIDWNEDTDGDGLINALDPDSDNDGLFDGTELGFGCDGTGTDSDRETCVADADEGATTTSPVIADTDMGGVRDGAEDSNLNGSVDEGELDPNLENDDAGAADSDGDGLPDDYETAVGSNPESSDSDGDGLPDDLEHNPTEDTDGDGLINLVDPDSDGDGLFDGTEAGHDCSSVDDESPSGNCIPDADDGDTVTSVLIADTDDGGVSDGNEDENKDGAIDAGETDPNDATDDAAGGGAGGAGGESSSAGGDSSSAGGDSSSMGAAGAPGTGGTGNQTRDQVLEGGGCNCSLSQTGSPRGALMTLGLLTVALTRRRRRRVHPA